MRYIPGTKIGIKELQEIPEVQVWVIAVAIGLPPKKKVTRQDCIDLIVRLIGLT